MKFLFILLLFLSSCDTLPLPAQEEYSDLEIAEAIWQAEGGVKATYPYGIRSVLCEGLAECRKICLNTVRNNRKRYIVYGYKQYPDFLSFLASRYAPTKNCENDLRGLNNNWLKNVRYFLTKGAK